MNLCKLHRLLWDTVVGCGLSSIGMFYLLTATKQKWIASVVAISIVVTAVAVILALSLNAVLYFISNATTDTRDQADGGIQTPPINGGFAEVSEADQARGRDDQEPSGSRETA